MHNPQINIEVVFATPTHFQIIPLKVLENTTIKDAITLSGLLAQFPEIQLGEAPNANPVGIWGKLKNLGDTVKENDRVEIYRPLLIDPKQARLQRVKALQR